MILDTVAQVAKEKCELKKDLPILVGVSGGADSLALLVGLKSLGYRLIVAHLDHGLRAEAGGDADFVRDLAKAYGLPFVDERVQIQKEVDCTGQSIEEAARNKRYQFLFQQARIFKAQAVAVGHHADDQVETVLMHFLRGAALPGLSGMPYRTIIPLWDDEIPLVRPLLDLWREEIDTFVAEQNLVPRMDHSNLDTTYFRNRLRHELIPQLETYNRRFRRVALRMVEVLREEEQLLQSCTQYAWEECLRAQTKDWVELSSVQLNSFPKATQRRVLRYAIAQLRPNLRDIGFDAIERGLSFAATPSERREIDLIAQLNLVLVADSLILKGRDADLPDWGTPLLSDAHARGDLDVDQPFELKHGWWLKVEWVREPIQELFKTLKDTPESEALLDADLVSFPLEVRSRHKRERWQPLGMGGRSQLISDFFINRKIPEHLRSRWPLVCSEDRVAWIVGQHPSERYKITDQTKRVLRLRLIKQSQV